MRPSYDDDQVDYDVRGGASNQRRSVSRTPFYGVFIVMIVLAALLVLVTVVLALVQTKQVIDLREQNHNLQTTIDAFEGSPSYVATLENENRDLQATIEALETISQPTLTPTAQLTPTPTATP